MDDSDIKFLNCRDGFILGIDFINGSITFTVNRGSATVRQQGRPDMTIGLGHTIEVVRPEISRRSIRSLMDGSHAVILFGPDMTPLILYSVTDAGQYEIAGYTHWTWLP